MAGNPVPQHNPTDGLAVAAYVQVSGTGIVANETVGANKPNAGNYTLTLSLTSSGGHALYCTSTASIVDVSDAAVIGANSSFTYKSYSPAVATYVAGQITAVAVGQAIVEAQFPTFDSSNGVLVGMIYTQIAVQVVP